MDVKSAARGLVDNVTSLPAVEDRITVAGDYLNNAYSKGFDEGTRGAIAGLNNAFDNAELWATDTLHKVTSFGEPVQFAIRYYHKIDGALREVLASSEQAVLAELHVLLLKDDATGVSVVRVNRG